MNDVISRSAEQYPIDGEELFNRVQNLKRYEVRRNLFDDAAVFEVFKCQDVLDAILASDRLDVAPVVRCKNCKLRGSESCPMHYEEYCGFGFETHDITRDDGYCDRGVRA